MMRGEFLPPSIRGEPAGGIIRYAAVLYLTWLYLTTLMRAMLPFAIFSMIGKLLAGGLLIMFLVFQPKRLRIIGIIPIGIGISMAIVAGLASLEVYTDPTDFIQLGYLIGTQVAIFLMFSALAIRERDLKVLLIALVVLAAINGLIGIWGAVTHQAFYPREIVGVGTLGFDETTGRAGGLQGENYVGLWVAPALVMGMANLVQKRFRILGIVLTSVSIIAVISSMSRTSAMCAVAVFVVWVFTLKKRNLIKRRMILLAMLASLIMYISYSVLQQQFSGYPMLWKHQQERWAEINTLAGRTDIWADVIDKALQAPLLGHGAASSFRALGTVAHNAFLDMFIDYGIIGLVLFAIPSIFLIGIFVFRRHQISQDKYLPILYGLFFAGLICWLSLSSAFNNIIWAFNGLLYGRIISLKRQQLAKTYPYMQTKKTPL